MKRTGFTLVEILIVVIILGILAAIVIPQFTNASQDARRSSLTSQVQTLRSQVELYKLQHGDALPDLTKAAPNTWDDLLTVTAFGGQNFGPYLQDTPKNPLNNLATVVDAGGPAPGALPANPGAAIGFVYDYNAGAGTGRIWGTDSDGVTLIP